MATIFRLIIEDDEGKTTVYPLESSPITVGRLEGNTIRLMERNVSRRHARLLYDELGVSIEDLDSYNGIRINGERIQGRYPVREGDLVEIGDYHLALQTLNEDLDQGMPPNSRTTVEAKPPPMMDFVLAGGSSRTPIPAFPEPHYEFANPNFRKAGPNEVTLAPGPSTRSSVPRLVCVSTEYAGQEFALTKPELIIGRVDDNDIVIEHRSVSRNHAKIMFDGRIHKIVDLQSANGILVNGEEYAMTDLRRGDRIELGHVAFRFVPADEAFRPTTDEAEAMRGAGVDPPEVLPPDSVSDGMELYASEMINAPTELRAFDAANARTVTEGLRVPPLAEEEPPNPPSEAASPDETRPDLLPAAQPSLPSAVQADRADRADRTVQADRAPVASLSPRPRASKASKPVAEPIRAAKATGGLRILVALLVVIILVLGVVQVNDYASGRYDRQLHRLFEEERFDDFQSYWTSHRDRFREASSVRLGGIGKEAQERVSQCKRAHRDQAACEFDLARYFYEHRAFVNARRHVKEALTQQPSEALSGDIQALSAQIEAAAKP